MKLLDFHTQKFLSYHKDRLFNDHSLLFYNKHDLVAVLPAAKITKNDKTTLYSHPGASYGGLITSQQLRLESLNNIIIALNKYCYHKRFDRLTMILTPSIYNVNSPICPELSPSGCPVPSLTIAK